ncbi:helix-turn-helix domain-containing protein [uncultured Litoreibacter sp.]|uniref:helix-turn-helix domain-containing protein n=1 Tax=uncultured Litoreibacter sp. TaxID=1392394 RepID=UPI0026330DBF|nr:helix-turn-helix domain-containing protein [uncultured Litoreibacter sp.]
MAKKYNWRKIKIHFPYEIKAAAKALGCSIATIRSWINQGLPVITEQKPFLIDGRDLSAFARAKSESLKWTKPETNAPWNYFPCFKCKAYRRPAFLMVDFFPSRQDKGRLEGLCEVCEGIIMKFCNVGNLDLYSTTLDVTYQLGQDRLYDP